MSGVTFYIFGKPIYWYGIIIALGGNDRNLFSHEICKGFRV